MPHSGGGGSHGGGSHGGGSHGGGSSGPRRSNHYFPGSRRYRRHYYDGRPDDYFYSDGRPKKTSKAAIIFMVIMAICTGAVFSIPIMGSVPRKLNEKYTRPESRIVDTIDIISNDDELEDALEEYNDITGICPVVQTIYIEDYQMGYNDLETYSYDMYLSMFSDEQHYLIVYAIPKDQRDAFVEGTLSVPDYEWEIMIGDETDNLYDEALVINRVQGGLEDGKNPGVVIADVIRKLGESDAQKLSRPSFLTPKLFTPLIIIGLFFIFPIIMMIRNIKKEKEFEYEEVPLEESDISSPLYSSGNMYGTASNTASVIGQTAGKAGLIIGLVFMIPFVLIGIGVLIGAIVSLVRGGSQTGLFLLFFAVIWLSISGCAIYSTIRKYKQISEGVDMITQRMNQPSPASDERDYYQSWPSHDRCRADHDDDDNVRPGYE